jgi:hypothetical protein
VGRTKSKNLTLFNPGGYHKHICLLNNRLAFGNILSTAKSLSLLAATLTRSEKTPTRPDRDQRPENRKRALTDTNACRRANSCLLLRTYSAPKRRLPASGSPSYRFQTAGPPIDQGQGISSQPQFYPEAIDAISTGSENPPAPSQQRPTT